MQICVYTIYYQRTLGKYCKIEQSCWLSSGITGTQYIHEKKNGNDLQYTPIQTHAYVTLTITNFY